MLPQTYSIGGKICNNIKNNSISFASYLKNKINETFFMSPVTEDEVYKELIKLNPKKSSGSDNINPRILKACANELKEPLTYLYNECISHCYFPDPWKLAKVIALFKKGHRDLPENYRPISLLSCFGKILEKLVHKQMITFINKHKILYIYQYGFREKYSTTFALIDIIDKIKDALDNNEYAIGIFLDIKKAFDCIDHALLLSKLDHYGFRGHINDFLQNYLSSRSQFTIINNTCSTTENIYYGVPQGSILGPLLFLIYINDIQYVTTNTELRLFADDTALFMHNRDLDILTENITHEMANVKDWFISNKLALSLNKSNFILFHSKRKNPANHMNKIVVGSDAIHRVTNTKYIGLILDENLSWGPHINGICKSLHKFFGIFYNIRNFINASIARNIYFTTIYSRIQYGIEIYGSASKTLLNKLQIMQNKLMKILLRYNRRHSTNDLHNEMKILKVEDIYHRSLLTFVYKCIIEEPIDPFKHYFNLRTSIHNYNTRGQSDIHCRRTNTMIGQTTVRYKGATLWNRLNHELRGATSVAAFKNNVTTQLLEKYKTN